MRLHKLCATLTATAVAAIVSYPAFAQVATDGVCQNCDAAGTLPGPGILSLVVLGIAVAIGLARRHS